MKHETETAQPAPLGQVERGVGRPVPERDDARMLELAATAAGYTWREDVAQQRGFEGVLGLWIPELTTLWNPLADSGQALDLAIRLKLWVYVGECQDGRDVYAEGDDSLDDEASTRLAIVRAAVQVARSKTPNVEFSGVPAGHSINHPAGGTSAGTQG